MNLQSKTLSRWVILFIFMLGALLPACGQKGDLYLPDKISEPVPARTPETNQMQDLDQRQDPGADTSETGPEDAPSGQGE